MKIFDLVAFAAISLLFWLSACQNRPLLTETIHHDQSLIVRLAVDPTVSRSHSHPAMVTTDEITAFLSGVIIEEPTNLVLSVPLREKKNTPPRHPAFTAAEIELLAPLLVEGLNSAKPEEIVTFYWITQQPPPNDQVTSGGIFVKGDEIHFILGNYRSSTRYPPDPETMTYRDGRSTPLQPLVPQEALLTFSPVSLLIPSEQGVFKNPFRSKRREITVLFRQLISNALDAAQEPR